MKEKLKSPFLRFLVLILGIVLAWNVAFYLMAFGQMLGGFLKLLLGMLPLPAQIVQSDAYVTGMVYIAFIGIWILCPIVLAILPPSRSILKSFGRGRKGNNGKMLLTGIGIGLGTNLICGLAAMLNGDIQLHFDSLQPIPLLLIFVVVFIQSTAEEMVCRGYIQRRIVSCGGKPWLAALVNCVFFSYIHVGNTAVTPLALVNLFLLGLLCTSMVVCADSLWAAMGIHTAWNFSQNILLGLPNSGYVVPFSIFQVDPAAATDSFANSVAFGPEGTLVATVVLSVSTVLVWLWHRKYAAVKGE